MRIQRAERLLSFLEPRSGRVRGCRPKPLRETLRSVHNLHDGGWALGGQGDGHYIRVAELLKAVAAKKRAPQTLRIEQICHKGMELSPSHDAADLNVVCAAALANAQRIQSACAEVPGIVVRSRQNPCSECRSAGFHRHCHVSRPQYSGSSD